MCKKLISIICVFIILLAGNMSHAYTLKGSYVNESDTKSSSINNSKEYQLIIEDDANLLSSGEEALLKQNMAKLTEYGNIIFKSILNNTYLSTDSYARNYYNSRFGSQSGTVFLIDMDERNIYIFSNGENYKFITDSKAEIITDNIYQFASQKQYYKCASEAFEQIYTILQGGKIAEPMKYISNAVLAIMVSLFINFIIYKLVTKNSKETKNEQIKECEKTLEHTTPIATKTGTKSVYSPQTSSSDRSSGGSSGGSSWGSSGGSSGGRWRRRRWRRP